MTQTVNSNEYCEKVCEIHSFDANYKNVLLINNNLLIPYINLGISNHPVNEGPDLQFVNYAYMVFFQVTYLSAYVCEKRLVIINSQKRSGDLVHNFGGYYLDWEIGVFNDLEIHSDKACLVLLANSKISEKMWQTNYMLASKAEREEWDKVFNHSLLPGKFKMAFGLE